MFTHEKGPGFGDLVGSDVLNLCYQVIHINTFCLPVSPPPFILPSEDLLVLASARAAFSLFSLKPNFHDVAPPEDEQMWLQCQFFIALVCGEALKKLIYPQMWNLCEEGRWGQRRVTRPSAGGVSVPEMPWVLQVISHLYDSFSHPHAWERAYHSLLAPLLLLFSAQPLARALHSLLLSFSIHQDCSNSHWDRSPSQTVQVCSRVFLLTVYTTHTIKMGS